MVQISGENSKPFWSMRSGLKDTGHGMSIGNLHLGVSSVTVSYLIRYDTLLQNATDIITKCDSYFNTKCDRSLLQNTSGFLLQNATVLLQNAMFITNCDSKTCLCHQQEYSLQNKGYIEESLFCNRKGYIQFDDLV